MQEWNKKARMAWLLVGVNVLIGLGFVLFRVGGCSVEKEKIVQVPAPVPPPTDDSGDDDGAEPPTPPARCGVPTFAEVKPLLTKSCLGCHSAPDPIDTYDTAVAWSGEIVRRVNLGAGNRDRMPPPPGQPLGAPDKALFAAWVEAGTPETCPDDQDSGAFLDFEGLERVMLDDLNRLDAEDRLQVRYLLTADVLDEGYQEAEVEEVRQAMDKALNSLNVLDDELNRATKVAPGLYRIELEDFGLNAAKWDALEAGDPLKVESFTDIGVLIKQLTGTERPFIHARNFVDTTHRNSAVYYTFTEIPATLAEYQAQIGVDFAAALAAREAVFIGSNVSPISLQKNRLIVRVDLDNAAGRDGYYWQTFDPIALSAGEEDRNLFEFPGLLGTGISKIFDFAASEVIVTAKNGMQVYSLWAADGTRQDAAPLNVVADNRPGPRGPEIRNAISCQKCHAGGIIPMRDQVRDKALQPGSGFTAQDVELIKALYRPQNVGNAAFSKDARTYAQAMAALGVDPKKDDPVNLVNDRYLLDWDLRKVASLLFLREGVFKELLAQSQVASAQVGQLASGGTITFDQLVQVLPVLIQDLRLFQEPL